MRPPARCQVPGTGALWLVRLFNGLPDSPFPLYVKNNLGECGKLITFGVDRLPLFSVSPLAKVQQEGLKGSDKHKMVGRGKNRRNSLAKPPAQRGTRPSFWILHGPFLSPAGISAAVVDRSSRLRLFVYLLSAYRGGERRSCFAGSEVIL